ncbi:timeless protein [Thamnocephalis sphaerospora]|uniref:Timeless protein n=1 Tax=Thamnocephalis sphaerospora TaxID=78915 RepID=A0A4P9XX25_9FUNG|nr:timeless protein [Thamnocephalis sphaerospora]|eukprot:RKP10983.1 timeless protein [Thamnocephalis sphaerospora]
MDLPISERLLNICSSLGGFEGTPESGEEARYVLGDECLDCLRDLKRYLRVDDNSEDKPVLRVLGESNVLNGDLLPILLLTCRGNTEDEELICAACIELLVPMTWPLEPQTPNRAQRLKLLWEYKYAFLRKDVLAALWSILTRWLAVEYR